MLKHLPKELIKIKAHEFWKTRQREGKDGTPESDWINARNYLEKHQLEVFQWKLTKTLSKRPLRRFAARWEKTPIEKFLEDVVFLLKNFALLDIINLLASITIIISLITWWTGRNERWEDEVFSTWNVVKEATGDKSGVPKLAVERLLKNKFSLAGLDLSQTNLIEANLQQASLWRANLQQASLWGANLQQASLWGVNLQQASLWEANLQQADLWEANLQQADLWGAKNLTPKQIKSACYWEKAVYKVNWDNKAYTYQWEVDEKANQEFIEQLKQDRASNPQEPIDCSRWE